jgi:hypothetical protein
MRRGYEDPRANDGLATPDDEARCGVCPPPELTAPFPDSRENFFVGSRSASLSPENTLLISRLGEFLKTAGSGILVPEDAIGSELAAEFGTGLPLV